MSEPNVYYPIRNKPQQCPRCGATAKLYPTNGYAMCWRCKEHAALDGAIAWATVTLAAWEAEHADDDETLYPVPPDDGDDDQGWYGTIPHV